MRLMRYTFIFCLLCGVASPAWAGLSVNSYDTQAQANAFAPLDESAYYGLDDKPNLSPAVCNVAADWTGTNGKGQASGTTWSMTATASAAIATTISSSSLAITGVGSFSYALSTTPTFVDPTRSATLYPPGAASDYQCYFTVDSPASYHAQVTLNQYGSLELASFTTGTVFDQFNLSAIPKVIDVSGVISQGRYELHANASFGGPSPLHDGVNSATESGSYKGLLFALQIPEPCCVAELMMFALSCRARPILQRGRGF